MKKHMLALAAGLVMSGGASAAVNLDIVDSANLGSFGAPFSWSEKFNVVFDGQGTIVHDLSFTITEDLYAGSGVFDNPLEFSICKFTVSVLNIDGLTAEIFDSSNTSYETFMLAGDEDHLTLPAGTLFTTGDYTLKIGGTVTGILGGSYTIAAVTAPVPEPEAWGMLLAGLGLIGLRLRQKRAPAA